MNGRRGSSSRGPEGPTGPRSPGRPDGSEQALNTSRTCARSARCAACARPAGGSGRSLPRRAECRVRTPSRKVDAPRRAVVDRARAGRRRRRSAPRRSVVPRPPVDVQAVHEAPARRHAAVEVGDGHAAGADPPRADPRAQRRRHQRARRGRDRRGRPTPASRCRRCWRRAREALQVVAERRAERIDDLRAEPATVGAPVDDAVLAAAGLRAQRPGGVQAAGQVDVERDAVGVRAPPRPWRGVARERPDRPRVARSRASASARCARAACPRACAAPLVPSSHVPVGPPSPSLASASLSPRRLAADAHTLWSSASAPTAGTRVPRRSAREVGDHRGPAVGEMGHVRHAHVVVGDPAVTMRCSTPPPSGTRWKRTLFALERRPCPRTRRRATACASLMPCMPTPTGAWPAPRRPAVAGGDDARDLVERGVERREDRDQHAVLRAQQQVRRARVARDLHRRARPPHRRGRGST